MIDTLAAAALEVAANADDRQWSVNRPSRGVHATAVRRAAVIPARIAKWAHCVSERESGGSYTARNGASSAQGRWQFLDRAWRDGLAFMVRDRLVRAGMPKPDAKRVRVWLQAHEIATWPGPFQDAGFAEVVARGGSYHWSLAGSTCEAFR